MKKPSSFETVDSAINLNNKTIFIALLLIIGGIALLLIGLHQENLTFLSLAVLSFVFSLPLLICNDCIALDLTNKKINLYRNFVLFKKSDIHAYTDFEYVVVTYDYSSSADGGNIEGASTHFYGTSSRHYEVFLIGKNNSRLLLREFDQPQHATKLQ
jgi:hypothetical protein